LKDGKVKVIIETEESDIKPVQICGKLLVSALSKYFIHERYGVVEMDDSVLFLQMLDSSKLKPGRTSNLEQVQKPRKVDAECYTIERQPYRQLQDFLWRCLRICGGRNKK